jgi:hypothetical protein
MAVCARGNGRSGSRPAKKHGCLLAGHSDDLSVARVQPIAYTVATTVFFGALLRGRAPESWRRLSRG